MGLDGRLHSVNCTDPDTRCKRNIDRRCPKYEAVARWTFSWISTVMCEAVLPSRLGDLLPHGTRVWLYLHFASQASMVVDRKSVQPTRHRSGLLACHHGMEPLQCSSAVCQRCKDAKPQILLCIIC